MAVKFRVRLRIHTGNFLTDNNKEPTFEVGGRRILVTSHDKGDNLNSTKILLNARQFPDKASAVSFGEKLKIAVSLASALRRFGVDTGEDRATSMIGKTVKDEIKEKFGVTLRNDVHGLDVFEDDDHVRFHSMSASATVSTPASVYFKQVDFAYEWAENLPAHLVEAAKLLNNADLADAPNLKLALACSSIETMAPDASWSRSTNSLLDHLILTARSDERTPDEERRHIIHSIQSMKDFGPSVGVRVRKLLDQLGLADQRGKLSKIYRVRSKWLHGKYISKQEQQDASERARSLALDLLFASLEKRGADTKMFTNAML
ncbi:MAG: hypothetical protein AAF495_28880 [Pseudomonadota bacterium]